MGKSARYNPTSPIQGYDLNIVERAINTVANKTGSSLNLKVKGTTYNARALI